jgi:hypothetical protein
VRIGRLAFIGIGSAAIPDTAIGEPPRACHRASGTRGA